MKRILEIIKRGDVVSIAGYTIYTDLACRKMAIRHPRSIMSPSSSFSVAGLKKLFNWMDRKNHSEESAL